MHCKLHDSVFVSVCGKYLAYGTSSVGRRQRSLVRIFSQALAQNQVVLTKYKYVAPKWLLQHVFFGGGGMQPLPRPPPLVRPWWLDSYTFITGDTKPINHNIINILP